MLSNPAVIGYRLTYIYLFMRRVTVLLGAFLTHYESRNSVMFSSISVILLSFGDETIFLVMKARFWYVEPFEPFKYCSWKRGKGPNY